MKQAKERKARAEEVGKNTVVKEIEMGYQGEQILKKREIWKSRQTGNWIC